MPYILCFHNISGRIVIRENKEYLTNLIEPQMKNIRENIITLRLNNEENEMLEKLSKH